MTMTMMKIMVMVVMMMMMMTKNPHWLGALTRTRGETGRWWRIDSSDRDIAD